MLASCATAPGGQFSRLAETPSEMGDVYIYRQSALYAKAGAFKVTVDGKPAGSLFDGSYLLLRMNPGVHTLSVDPCLTCFSSTLQIQANAGNQIFLEYYFETGLLANSLFIGSSIEPRPIGTATADLKALNAATADQFVRIESAGQFATIENVGAVPYLNARGRDGYKEWLKHSPPRAFAIRSDGRWSGTWGLKPSTPTEPNDPAQRALARCNPQGTSPCKLYAVDNSVVWEK
jgi:hypothetical protein